MTEPAGPPAARGRRMRAWTLIGSLLVVQSAYLAASASPALFYISQVFLHVLGGTVLAWPLVRLGLRAVAAGRRAGDGSAAPAAIALSAFVVALGAAAALIVLGNTRDRAWLLWTHVGAGSAAAAAALAALALAARRTTDPHLRAAARDAGIAVVAAAGLVGIAAALPEDRPAIRNAGLPPAEMAGEAMGGAGGPFFPSAAETSTGGRIPSNFFETSATCGRSRCHPNIYQQWEGSAHHFSSFNNQWYRKSIEYMQEVNSIQSSKWCGGCHDHAVLFNGMMDAPIQTILHTPEAQVGLGCNSCHALTAVNGTVGNGAFRIEYPPLHDLAASENRLVRLLHDVAVHLDPAPHRGVFLKPFHRADPAEFCSACHKVHLDVPVNNYRWIRGFNEYDNWQASGVSGQGARSFYYPPEPKACRDCHMPLVASNDRANRDGFVHDHSFPAANTAVPLSHLRERQLLKTIEFLQAGQVTVDLFAAGPARPEAGEAGEGPGGGEEPRLASTFAIGEEAAGPVGRPGLRREPPPPVWAPLDRAEVVVAPGQEVRVDAVVRTRNVGHFFPGGTVDAFDVWLELRASDAAGRMLYWSGPALDGGAGPVDGSAHFYRSLMVDGHGNPIDRRNAWATRSVVYVNLIPPGAADTAHFRLRIPEDASGEITLEARLNYRKFSHANTAFSFAGRPADGEPARREPGQDRVTVDWDDREFVEGPVPADVSAEVEGIPVLPIVVMARDTATLRVGTPAEAAGNASPPPLLADRERWNDYGIGLLRQGDLRGAERAFRTVVAIDVAYADGFVNIGRVRMQEGDLPAAREALEQALRIDPDLASAHYFLGVERKESGDYQGALEHLEAAAASYPRDRVVLNAIGRVLFLDHRHDEAAGWLLRVLEIDQEDVAAHYNLMLAYRGLGRAEESERHRVLYERFKADEDAQIITGPYRRDHPDDNRERQPIHEHPSAGPEVIAAEEAIRRTAGEPHVVLPGEAAAWVRRAMERLGGSDASADRETGG